MSTIFGAVVPVADEGTDFSDYRRHIGRCRSTGDVKSLVADRLFSQIDSMDVLMDMWQIEDENTMVQWWETQAANASEVSLFVYDLFTDLGSKCGLPVPATVDSDRATLVELGKCPPTPGIFHASFLVLDDLMGRIREVPDDCEFWSALDCGPVDGDDGWVFARCGVDEFRVFVPEDYIW